MKSSALRWIKLLPIQSQSLRSRHLYSSSLVSTSTSSADGLNWLLTKTNDVKFCFVGGKGGVGKTSTSSAIAIQLSDMGFRTLVVSTDPAHSLGDALGLALSPGQVTPVLTDPNLSALEIDVEAAMESFRNMAKELDANVLARNLGIPVEMIQSLGLSDMGKLLADPPPGIDEVLALQSIFKLSTELDARGRPRFDRIVIDTAPTGHTLRLLQLPEFLNSFTGKVMKFRSKLQSAISTFQTMFSGGKSAPSAVNKLDSLWTKMENLQAYMAQLKTTLRDGDRTQFTVVTIPTALAVAESKRLISSLQGQDIRVAAILCNQVLLDAAGLRYVDTRKAAQRRCIDTLRQSSSHLNLEVQEVGYVDTEVVGIPGLRFFAALAHRYPEKSRLLTIFGGKGGVGKTTSAASWAVRLSDHGHRVLVISTDPAHSLGDALQESLSGTPRLVERSPMSSGELWAMEIDPVTAIQEFKNQLRESGSSDGLPANINDDLASLVDDPPPGIDEVAALTKVMSYLEEGVTVNGVVHKFDRIVLDTAPTGHTLRMLQLPQFLMELLQRVKNVKQKVGTLGGLFGMMNGGPSSATASSSVSSETPAIDRYQQRMNRLEDLIHDTEKSEFTVVTIPTELATAESSRLLTSLTAEGIPTRRLIINQVLQASQDGQSEEAVTNSYLNRLRRGQQVSMSELEKMATQDAIPLYKVPYFDMEVRTVYGLRAISQVIFPQKDSI